MTTTRTDQLRNTLEAQPVNGAPTSGAVAKKVDPARDLLASMQDEFAAALPNALPIDLFMRVALTGFRKTPELLECSRRSLLGALLETARLGLEPCTEMAYLIPYRSECTLVVGYQGFVQLMYRTGQVEQVNAEMIHENDEWEYTLGDGGRFFHRPRIDVTDEERGKPIIAYSFATLASGGRTKVAHVNRQRAEQISREYAKSSKSPWRTGSFDAMWLKSPVRQLQKWAPKSAEIRRALLVDGATFDQSGQPDVDIDDPKVIPGEFLDGSASPTSGAGTGATTEDPWGGLDVAQPGGGAS